MVLAQLEGHTRLLESVVTDIATIKQTTAVNENNTVHWRESADERIEDLQTKVTFILHDEKGVNVRLKRIEDSVATAEKVNSKFKAAWALYGAVAVFVIDLAIKLGNMFLQHIK